MATRSSQAMSVACEDVFVVFKAAVGHGKGGPCKGGREREGGEVGEREMSDNGRVK